MNIGKSNFLTSIVIKMVYLPIYYSSIFQILFIYLSLDGGPFPEKQNQFCHSVTTAHTYNFLLSLKSHSYFALIGEAV